MLFDLLRVATWMLLADNCPGRLGGGGWRRHTKRTVLKQAGEKAALAMVPAFGPPYLKLAIFSMFPQSMGIRFCTVIAVSFRYRRSYIYIYIAICIYI